MCKKDIIFIAVLIAMFLILVDFFLTIGIKQAEIIENKKEIKEQYKIINELINQKINKKTK